MTLTSLDFKFALLIAIFQHYVSTKLEVSMTFLYLENRRLMMDDGQGATPNVAPEEGP